MIDDRDDLPLGRLTLTYCLDTATRYPLGYYLGFEPPSYLTVMECLHHAIQPKGDVRQLYGTEHVWLAYGMPAPSSSFTTATNSSAMIWPTPACC